MALTEKTLFLYNFQVTDLNRSIDFRALSGGSILSARLTLGYYSLTSLLNEIMRALNATDPDHIYTATANRNISGGLQNRVTISTNHTYLDFLFGTGPLKDSTVATLIGFAPVDRVGATSYTGTLTAGVALVTEKIGYNYLPPELYKKNFGSVNVSSNGIKEAIVFQQQSFLQAQFRYEPETKVKSQWRNFMSWATYQREFEITPEITSPSTFYPVTVETTSADGKGLAYKFSEQLSEGLPFHYDTGLLTFRVVEY
jgi:hypothetical protein